SDRPRMYHRPSSSIAAQSPCTHVSGKRDQYVCSYRSGSCQKPRVIPIHGARTTSSPTWLRTEWPCSSTTSAAIPGGGPANEQGFIGVSTLPETRPPETSVPPE